MFKKPVWDDLSFVTWCIILLEVAIRRWVHWMMNEWCIYIALFVYCCTPKALFTIMWGVSPQPPPVCSIHLDDATAATGQRRQCAHHTPATGGEEREIEPIKWMGIIRRPWLTRASGGNLARTPGLHPTLYEKCHGIFNDHRESGPRFNVSSERQLFQSFIVQFWWAFANCRLRFLFLVDRSGTRCGLLLL